MRIAAGEVSDAIHSLRSWFILETAFNAARPSRSQDQTGLNAEIPHGGTLRNERKRTLSANLCESLRLSVKSSTACEQVGLLRRKGRHGLHGFSQIESVLIL